MCRNFIYDLGFLIAAIGTRISFNTCAYMGRIQGYLPVVPGMIGDNIMSAQAGLYMLIGILLCPCAVSMCLLYDLVTQRADLLMYFIENGVGIPMEGYVFESQTGIVLSVDFDGIPHVLCAAVGNAC